MTEKRLTPEELGAVKVRRTQAVANNAIEGIGYTPEHEAMFIQFDEEGLTHEERLQRVILRIKTNVPTRSE
jgi:hypothetical protein